MQKGRKRRITRSLGGNIVSFSMLAIIGVFMALPLVYAFSGSLKPIDEIFVFPPKLLVNNPTFDNFLDMFYLFSNSMVAFTRYIFNSGFIAVSATILHVILASMAAYPLAKNKFPMKGLIFGIVVTCLLFVPQVTFVPLYIIISKLGMTNTYLALIFPAVGSSLGLFLMKQFIESIPIAMIESARVEGSTEFHIFRKIIMPNVKPAWLTLIIFTFNGIWNTGSSTLIFDEQLKTLPAALSQLVAGNNIARMGVGMAATVFIMIPPIVLFVVLQSRVLETMAFAGIKE